MNTDAVHVNKLARPEQTADIRGVCICRKNRRDIEADMACNNCFLCAHFMFLLKIMIHPVLQNENRGHHEELCVPRSQHFAMGHETRNVTVLCKN